MKNLYNSNGLLFWNSTQIQLRRMFEDYLVGAVSNCLKIQNRAFNIVQVEAPLLTPRAFINKNYTDEDMYCFEAPNGDEFVLRPETTMGSYQALEDYLNPHNEMKYRLPLCIWQHGKSFRREQDQPTKFMRLKEFYQLEFQIAYSPTTANDYAESVIPAVHEALQDLLGFCTIEPSDRLPDYSESTMDIICNKSRMEVCSISKRKDFPGAKILEVAIGTDRCVYNFINKKKMDDSWITEPK